MRVNFSFLQMEVSDPLKQYAEDKIRDKVDKFVTKPIEANITFSVKRQSHKAHCSISGGDGFNIDVEAVCGDMYGSIDMLIDKVATKLRKRKEILKDHKKVVNLRNLKLKEPEYEEESLDAEDVIRFEEARKRLRAG